MNIRDTCHELIKNLWTERTTRSRVTLLLALTPLTWLALGYFTGRDNQPLYGLILVALILISLAATTIQLLLFHRDLRQFKKHLADNRTDAADILLQRLTRQPHRRDRNDQ